jgi:hypothetical protein
MILNLITLLFSIRIRYNPFLIVANLLLPKLKTIQLFLVVLVFKTSMQFLWKHSTESLLIQFKFRFPLQLCLILTLTTPIKLNP